MTVFHVGDRARVLLLTKELLGGDRVLLRTKELLGPTLVSCAHGGMAPSESPCQWHRDCLPESESQRLHPRAAAAAPAG